MSKDKNIRLVSALHGVADMVGARKVVNGNDIGLGMQLQHNRCMEEARMVTDGLFRVVVMGTFTSGKSTLINALLGSKVLPESALPSTAILTFIQFGCDMDDVEIHYRDIVNEDGTVAKGAVEHISKENFMQIYHYDIADTEKLSQMGSIPRFKKNSIFNYQMFSAIGSKRSEYSGYTRIGRQRCCYGVGFGYSSQSTSNYLCMW